MNSVTSRLRRILYLNSGWPFDETVAFEVGLEGEVVALDGVGEFVAFAVPELFAFGL